MSKFRQHHKTVREPSPWALSSLAGVVFIALALSLAHHLDTEDHSAEWGEAQQMQDAQALQDAEAKFQAEAQALCNTARGPNSEARWMPDGSLACTTRRAVRKAQVQL